jgi:hypothetical protein
MLTLQIAIGSTIGVIFGGLVLESLESAERAAMRGSAMGRADVVVADADEKIIPLSRCEAEHGASLCRFK